MDIRTIQDGKTVLQNRAYRKIKELSQARAQSVSSYLLGCGVSASQIKTVEGMGESNPVADNSTEAGRKEKSSCRSIYVCKSGNDSAG